MENRGLNSLCSSNGWSYAVFWRFHPPNHMLLTMEAAYFDQNVESVVNTMPPAQMLGQGIIGQAALDGKHRWMLLDALPQVCKVKSQFSSSDGSEFSTQSLFGIKTVAVIPVELCGVLQFGSTKVISETHEFLGQATEFLLREENFVTVASEERVSSLNCDHMDLNGMFASASSSSNSFPVSCEPFFDTLGSCSTNDPLPFFAQTINESDMDWCGSGELITNPNLGSLVIDSICDDRLCNLADTFKEEFEPLQLPTSLFDPCQMDDVSQWFADSSNLCFMGLDAVVSENMSHTLEVECKPSGHDGSDIFSGTQGKSCANSSHCSLSDALNSTREGDHLAAPSYFKGQKFEDCCEDIVTVVSNKDDLLPVQTGSVMSISEGISGKEGGSIAVPRKGLFSELGLEHLLSDSPCISTITKTYTDDECPTKRRRIESNQKVIGKHMQLSDLAIGANWKHPTSSGGLLECKPKSQTGLLIDENYSRDVKSCIISGTSTQTRTEESVKTTKKRAKPGESTRPRPKDRQMIADRIKELRDLIPDGAKLSIDALLGRTIKHMLFMQSLAKHADKLKQVKKPKLIGEAANSLVQNGGSSKSASSGGTQSRGATWAYEVGGRNLFCPIIVEDLDHPGQMLIEMLCEDQGYLLEIADIVRDLGLTILKGVMEARDDKMWAHFIVEGNKHVNVTRMKVFISLMQLLQGTDSISGGNKKIELAGKVENNEAQLASLWRNFQKQQVVI